MGAVFGFLSTALEMLLFIPSDTDAPLGSAWLISVRTKARMEKSVASLFPSVIWSKSSIKPNELPSITLKKVNIQKRKAALLQSKKTVWFELYIRREYATCAVELMYIFSPSIAPHVKIKVVMIIIKWHNRLEHLRSGPVANAKNNDNVAVCQQFII